MASMDQQNSSVTKERMRLIFEEWIRRSPLLTTSPQLVFPQRLHGLTGEACYDIFTEIAAEMDAQSKLPLPRAAATKPTAEPKSYFNIDDVPEGYSVQQVSRNKFAVVQKDHQGIRIVRCKHEGITDGLQLVYPNSGRANEVCQWLKDSEGDKAEEGCEVASIGELAKKLSQELTETIATDDAGGTQG